VAACEYVEANGITGNAFTTYGEGAYVVWRLWPRVKVSMDSRNSVYGEDLYRSYRAALRSDEGMAAYLHTWPPDLAVVSHRGPFRRGFDPDMDRDHDLPHRAFLASGDLALVDFDDVSAVYLARAPEHEELLERDAFSVIHPVLLPPVFSDADLPQAVAEAERAVARHPGALVARWILANAYAQSRRPEEALEQLAVLSSLGRETAVRWGVGSSMEAARLGLTGLMEWQAGRCEAARRALEEALRVDPDYTPARELLAQLGC
jgi:tetratricopeptide (TPR) repeat protein